MLHITDMQLDVLQGVPCTRCVYNMLHINNNNNNDNNSEFI